MVTAENRKTGKTSKFSDAHWAKLQKSKIDHPWIQVDESIARNKIQSGKAVEIPEDVLNFKNKANTQQEGGQEGKQTEPKQDLDPGKTGPAEGDLKTGASELNPDGTPKSSQDETKGKTKGKGA